jgi:hypothetical protein
LDNINTVGCLELFEKQFTGNMGIVGGKPWLKTGNFSSAVKGI